MLMAFDHDGDCGIYMVGTRSIARRPGLATALSAHAIAEARARGRTTASRRRPRCPRAFTEGWDSATLAASMSTSLGGPGSRDPGKYSAKNLSLPG